MKNYVLIFLFLLCGMVGFTSCVYTPIKGYNGNSKIDPQYLDFWYRQQILPAYAGYLSQVKRLDEMAGELEKYPEKLVELKGSMRPLSCPCKTSLFSISLISWESFMACMRYRPVSR